jgi:chemotaxis protein MotB
MMQKRNTTDDPKPVDNTIVLFTSISLILLTFFIMMTAKANFDEVKYGKVLDSVSQTFGVFSGGYSVWGNESGLAIDAVSLGDGTTRTVQGEGEMSQLRAILAPELLDGEARIVHNKGQRVITLSSGLLFDRDSSDLSQEAKDKLLAFCRVMRDSEIPISIEGHTDNLLPTTEGLGDNWDLSMDRALSVLEFFISEGGLDMGKLTAYGYGGQKPIVANNSPNNRSKNNRVDLVLDFDQTRNGALKGLMEQQHSFEFEGFQFLLPEKPGGEDAVY